MRNSEKKIKENTTDRAYSILRAKMIDFDFLPGQRINEVDLSKELSVSRAPIREALNRLIGEELVYFEPGKGFFCRKLKKREIAELYEIRLDLETSAVRSICTEVDKKAVEALLIECKEVKERFSSYNKEDMIDIDEKFHMTLLALAGNDERLKIMKNINERIHFVRRINLESPERQNKFINEHLELVEAIYHEDVKKSIALIREHLGFNSEFLSENIRIGLERIYDQD